MKQLALIIILSLILATSLIKNSTKEIEDSIFITNENIRLLKVEFSNEMLEYNYLSSTEKLIQHQNQYFENNLIKIDITKVKKIAENNGKLAITTFIDKPEVDELKKK